jgi:mono/diheme cytochrome c family protein
VKNSTRFVAMALFVAGASTCQKASSKHNAEPSPAPVAASSPQPQPDPLPVPAPTPVPRPLPAAQPRPVPPPPAAPTPALPDPSVAPTLEATLASVQSVLADKRCVSCHTEASRANNHVVLTDLATISFEGQPPAHVHDSPEPRRDLIKKGCPDQSFFLSILKEGKMPPAPQPRLTTEELATVAKWITNLGPENQAPDYCRDPTEPGDDGDFGP